KDVSTSVDDGALFFLGLYIINLFLWLKIHYQNHRLPDKQNKVGSVKDPDIFLESDGFGGRTVRPH
ncbi:hypothetical protein DPMN_169441, partial [Dreissena polymorpha]